MQMLMIVILVASLILNVVSVAFLVMIGNFIVNHSSKQSSENKDLSQAMQQVLTESKKFRRYAEQRLYS